MTVAIVSVIGLGVIVPLSSCIETSTTADQVQAQQTNELISEAQRQVGMPNITNFQQRKIMKMILELCDQEDLITYTYIKSDYTGKLVFLGQSIGYGVPFSAQFTNPERVLDAYMEGMVSRVSSGDRIKVLPQADPNGLFMPTSSSATWVLLVNPDTGEPQPVYIESEITVSPFKLQYGVE